MSKEEKELEIYNLECQLADTYYTIAMLEKRLEEEQLKQEKIKTLIMEVSNACD